MYGQGQAIAAGSTLGSYDNAAAKGYAEHAPDVRPTVLGTAAAQAEQQAEILSMLASRVERFSDRLRGAVPTPAAVREGVANHPVGHAPAALRLDAAQSAVNQQLGRLQSALDVLDEVA